MAVTRLLDALKSKYAKGAGDMRLEIAGLRGENDRLNVAAAQHAGCCGDKAEIARLRGDNDRPGAGPAAAARGGECGGGGTGVAGSPLIASDPAALRFAGWTGLAAVQPAVGRNDVTDEIDLAVGAAAPGAAASTPAYAAYEAARVLGRALVMAGGDPADECPHVREAAELEGSPLGRTALDAAGDLRVPVTYGAWSVPPPLSQD